MLLPSNSLEVPKCKAQIHAEEKNLKWGNDRSVLIQKRAMILNEMLFRDRYNHLLQLQKQEMAEKKRKETETKLISEQKNVIKTLNKKLKEAVLKIKAVERKVKADERAVYLKKKVELEKKYEKRLENSRKNFEIYKRKHPDYNDDGNNTRYIRRKR